MPRAQLQHQARSPAWFRYVSIGCATNYVVSETREADDSYPARTRSSAGGVAVSSPYSTGGGGTVLEHRYGALLLSHLLSGDPIPLLGDDATTLSVRFQAGPLPVDDFLVVGRVPDGRHRQLSVAVRRAPSFVPSDPPSVALLASYIPMVTTHWDDVHRGDWRLGLAVANRDNAVRQLEELATIASAHPDASAFLEVVNTPGRTTNAVRRRLEHFGAAVAAAATEVGDETPAGELAWRLLSALRIVDLRLEGANQADRTNAVARLRRVTSDGTAAAAEAVFTRLEELVGGYGPAGAVVTVQLLHRHLAGFGVARSPGYERQWAYLDLRTQRLRERVRSRLVGPEGELEFARTDAANELHARMAEVAAAGGSLVVHGEPDVGKSSLVLRTADRLRDEGVEVVALSLRELPSRTAELEAELGEPLESVLGAAASGHGRVFVVDGAESALEGQSAVFLDVATAALRLGFGIVAVTRNDGARAVEEELQRASEVIGSALARPHTVPGLTEEETREIGAAFPSLARLLNDERTSRLLSRPGLVDLLLRAGDATRLEDRPLAEADIFAAIWMGLVRNGERVERGGPTPEAREEALHALARRSLGATAATHPADASALRSLRRDGLLLSTAPAGAWTPRDEFASDLIRDFTLAHLLTSEGWSLVDSAGAPRWAIRAVRLACQGVLISAPDREVARRELQVTFDAIAHRHGSRWSELPLEALLTLGDAQKALTDAWPSLAVRDSTALTALLRLAKQRYANDTLVLAPIIELAFCGDRDLGQHDRHDRDGSGRLIRDLVLEWLQRLSQEEAPPNPVRQHLRDVLLEQHPPGHDEFAVQAIATLAADLDATAEVFLLDLASSHSEDLAPAVEEVGPIVALAAARPDLLLRLAEAYYIEPPRKRRRGRLGPDLDFLKDGIRHHRPGGLGRLAAWYYGPFFRLLHTRPREAVEFINRMVDAAAVVDAGRTADGTDGTETPVIELMLPGVGTLSVRGSTRAWAWYRGSSIGPYPCMSALLAVERFADHLVTIGIRPDRVAALLLRSCHNLAMLGLVVGFFVRHGTLEFLEPMLASPELWHLEFSRVASEGVLHVQGPDDEGLAGRDRRRYTFREVAGELVLSAVARGDEDRLTALAAIGDRLVANARAVVADTPAADSATATVEGWAASLRRENYVMHAEGGGVYVQFRTPAAVAARLQPGPEELSRGLESIRLLNTYAVSENREGPLDTLADDVAVAQALEGHVRPDAPFLRDRNAVVAVAATAVVAAAEGRARLPEVRLKWAASTVINAALEPAITDMSVPESYFSQGQDRSAAVALPGVGMTGFFDDVALLDRYIAAVKTSARSYFDEVRAAFVTGARAVWTAECRLLGGRCIHEHVWDAIVSGLADCRLGGRNERGERRLEPLHEPYEETLPTVPTNSVYLNRISHPLIAAWHARQTGACVAEPAGRLFAVLSETHRRVASRWAAGDYGGYSDRDRERVAWTLAEAAAAGHPAPLVDHVDTFADSGRALDQFLSDLARRFTYERSLDHAFRDVWRVILTATVTAWEAGRTFPQRDRWADHGLSAVIPVPTISMAERDVNGRLAEAREHWLAAQDLWDLVERWEPFARGVPKAVDAVVRLVEPTDRDWQARTALPLVERLMAEHYEQIASRTWHLVDWLGDIRDSAGSNREELARWRRIIDSLAAEGDSKAARLQAAEE